MKNITTLLLLCVTTIAAFAQETQKQYFEAHMTPCKPNAFAISRQINKITDSLYAIHDTDSDGIVFLSGFLSSPDLEFLDNRIGQFIYYDAGGKKTSEGQYVAGKCDGKWIYYEPDGITKLKEVFYSNGNTNKEIEYHADGKSIRCDRTYEGNKLLIGKEYSPSGTLEKEILNDGKTEIEYYDNGKVRRTSKYEWSKLLSEQCLDENGAEVPCVKSSDSITMPIPGYDMNKFLSRVLHFPDYSREKGVQGRVQIKFTVLEDGTIAGVNIFRSMDAHLDLEALIVVNAMPKWKPGRKGGKAIRCSYTQPLTFKLE